MAGRTSIAALSAAVSATVAIIVTFAAAPAAAAPAAPTPVVHSATPQQCVQERVRAIDPRLARTNPREYARRVQEAVRSCVATVTPPRPTSTRPTTTTTTTTRPTTTARPTTTKTKPTTTTTKPTTTTTTTPPGGGANSRTCSSGAVMAYESTGPTSQVTFECSAPSSARALAAPTEFSYTGRGKFLGRVRVATSCPEGSIQVRTGGYPQGAAGQTYYAPTYSVDGRTVSYDFPGNANGAQSDWYVSGSCQVVPPTTTPPGTCTTSRAEDPPAVYSITRDCPSVLPGQFGSIQLDCDGTDYFSSYGLDDPGNIAGGEVTINADGAVFPHYASVDYDNTTSSPQPLRFRVSCQQLSG